MLDDDADRRAILKRRRRWIALALAGATSTAGLGGGALAQDASAEDGGEVQPDAAPGPCLTAPRGGCE
jgi:hypothetical protein